MKPPRMIAKVICSGCLIVAALAAAIAQTPGSRVDLSLIVTDKSKKPLSTIRREDVRVFEDKVEQTILTIEADERPVDIALVIDASLSVSSFLPSIFEAARQIITQRRPGDEIFIESFTRSDDIQAIHEFSGSANTLTASLDLIQVRGGQSAVLDAISVGATNLAEHNKIQIRRRALVLISDGEDRNSVAKLEKVLKQLRVEDVQVFVIGLITELRPPEGIGRLDPKDKAKKLLTTLAEESGGLVFFPGNKKEITTATELISAALRTQFRLAYQSSDDPTKIDFRKVEVKLTSTSGKAIAPRGYYVEANQKSTEPKSP